MTQRYRAKLPLIFSLFVGLYLFITAAAAYQLPACHRVNQTVYLEKDGCPRCHPVETSICSGHCVTKDPIIINNHVKTLINPFKALRAPRHAYQNVCTYEDFYYQTVQIPGCPYGVDPSVTFPVALSCHCSVCTMDSSDCSMWGPQPELCTNDLPFYYY
ncbi:lutropin subunit beta [Gouania willdenowi]|uniref:Gonadotropin subunit beta-2 n=1 Tax=Gouania willdenowi TaxID=441366 RepID=A0A8C5E7W2_GOUWI|nr:gonadotropin subunit beta-2-like [Gouania willdenowi]